MMAHNPTTPHLILAATPVWSHVRALCVFGAKLAAERPVVVTLVIPHWMSTFSKANAEVERCLKDVVVQRGQIRVVGLGEHSMTQDPGEIFSVGYAALEPFWKAIVAKTAIECSATGKRYDSVAKPSFVVLDAFLYPWYSTIRTLSPSVPLFVWSSGAIAGMNYICLPARFGGKRVDPATAPTPEEPRYTGSIVATAGLPPMYDWEFSPQEMPMIEEEIHAMLSRALLESDGILTTNAVGYDGADALSVMSKWSDETNRPTFHLGPMLPFKEGTTEFSQATLDAEVAAAPKGVGEAIQSFLDRALATKGEYSVIYIGFGTHFWPSNPDHLWALLGALADRKIPFILSHASPMAQIPDAIKEQYADAKKGLIVPWSPQQTVMAHKAVGWFVTHGGANGTMDALTQGVPMIGWPFMGDQPSNIAYLAHVADVAFEFIEVRTGEFGLKPMLSSGKTPTGTLDAFREELAQVLDSITGEVGSRKRANARKMQAELAMAWAEGGAAREAFSNLVKRYGL